MPIAQSNGCPIHYEVEGDASKPVLMFCNSLGTNLHMWDAQMPEVLKHFRVVRYDRRGHGKSGVPAGPYLILPLLEPMTIRDGIGRGVDAAMNPLTWVGPAFWISITMKAVETVNDRALNLELFQGFEESVVDLYSAVRNAYLRRRQQMIKE